MTIPPMVPSAEDRAQAESIIEAFENNDLAGSLTDEIAECLAAFRRQGFLAAVALLREPHVFHAARSGVMGVRGWEVLSEALRAGSTNVEISGDIARAVLAAIAGKLGGEG